MIDSGTRKAIIDKLLGKKVNNFVNGRKVKDESSRGKTTAKEVGASPKGASKRQYNGNVQGYFSAAGDGGGAASNVGPGACHRGSYQGVVLASYCSECGEKLNEGWKYCAGCGRELQGGGDLQSIQEDKGGGKADLLGGVLKNKGFEDGVRPIEIGVEDEAARKELREKVMGQGINVNVIKGILR